MCSHRALETLASRQNLGSKHNYPSPLASAPRCAFELEVLRLCQLIEAPRVIQVVWLRLYAMCVGTEKAGLASYSGGIPDGERLGLNSKNRSVSNVPCRTGRRRLPQ